MPQDVLVATQITPAPRFPPLAWRRPAPAWIAAAVILALSPVPFLGMSFSLATLTGFGVIAAIAASLGAARFAQLQGRPPRARREVIMVALAVGGGFAALTPALAGFFSGAMGTPGFTAAMATSLWPLGLMVGLPLALLAGLLASVLALEKPPPREPLPDLQPSHDA